MIFTDIYELVHMLEYMIGQPVYVVSYSRAKDKIFNLKIIKAYMTDRYTIERCKSTDNRIDCDATINIQTNYASESYKIINVFLAEDNARRYINGELSHQYKIIGDTEFVNYVD